jgi:hypothetical protein
MGITIEDTPNGTRILWTIKKLTQTK